MFLLSFEIHWYLDLRVSERTSFPKKSRLLVDYFALSWRLRCSFVIRQFFVEWVNLVLSLDVKKYFQENNLPLHALLVLGDAPVHPVYEGSLPFVQHDPYPAAGDQHVIPNLKTLFTKSPVPPQLWSDAEHKSHPPRVYNIVISLKIIDMVLQGVRKRTLASAESCGLRLWLKRNMEVRTRSNSGGRGLYPLASPKAGRGWRWHRGHRRELQGTDERGVRGSTDAAAHGGLAGNRWRGGGYLYKWEKRNAGNVWRNAQT